ncbi:MAG TPA: hypothetical protein VE153_36705 [Myxococcus sp.]|nr:hypothetical protein [Myxococcus sp.]
MHRVSTVDGLDYVVVLDGLGLSSWCLPDEVVTAPDIQGSSDAVLSVDGTGRLVLAWDDGYDRSHLVAVDTLKPEERYARFALKSSFLDATGEKLLRVLDSSAPRHVERCDLNGVAKAKQPLPYPVQLPVVLSTGLGAPAWSHARWMGHAGRLAVVDEKGRLLLADLRDFKMPRALASGLLEVPPHWDVRVAPLEDALGVIAHDVAGGQAVVWVLAGGAVRVRKTLQALTMPAFVGRDTVLTQVSDRMLERVSLQDGSAQKLLLPEVGRETKLDPRGPGEPIAGGAVTAFLPWHRESLTVFDAETGEPSEVSRLLPEDTRELRRLVLERVRQANEAARPTGTRFELRGLDLTPKRKSYGVALSAQGGDGSFWAHAVAGALRGMSPELSERPFGEWRLASMSHPAIQVTTCPVTSEDELAALLGRVDQYGFRFSNVASAIENLYTQRAAPAWVEAPVNPPLTDGAGRLLLQALLAWLGTEGGMPLAPQLAQWRAAPASAAALAALVLKLHPAHARTETYLLSGLARLAAVHFKAEAGPLLLSLARNAPPEYLNNAKHSVVEALRWWAGRYPAVAKPLAKRVADIQLRHALDPETPKP